jgi:hypothetical protein
MPIQHIKEFGIYHWDTFDNETFLVDEADTLKEAQDKVGDRYGSSIATDGADQIDIVDKKGTIIKRYKVK